MEKLGKQALSVLLATCEEFPGLLIDDGEGDNEVNGADLTEWLCACIEKAPGLKRALASFSAFV